MATDLFYTERRLLQAYYYFFNRKFSFDNPQCEIIMQNMAYFLQRKNWMHTDFEFTLTPNGMYSPGLEAKLLKMKEKREDVEKYLSGQMEEISLRDWKWLNQLSDLYLIDEYDDIKEWITALACTLYVNTSVLPNQPFPVICKRVKSVVKLPDVFIRNAWGRIKK